MRRYILYIFLLLGAEIAKAQTITHEKDFVLGTADSLVYDQPVDVQKDSSLVKISCGAFFLAKTADRIKGIVFKGYNPGNESMRHLKIWLGTDGFEYPWLVYDNDYQIPHGGSAEDCIDLLNIKFDTPFNLTSSRLWIKIECSGKPSETPIYFQCSRISSSSIRPVVTFKVEYDVKLTYFDGIIINQEGVPVSKATVSVSNLAGDFSNETDADGHFSVGVELYKSYNNHNLYISANNYASYRDYVTINPQEKAVGIQTLNNYILFNKIPYYKDISATMILPVAPNPEWGRFYKLTGANYDSVFFERDFNPEANTPYVIFPNEDFELNVGDYDITIKPGIVVLRPLLIREIGFVGSYENTMAEEYVEDLNYKMLIDSTPDCEYCNGCSIPNLRIGAFRAYLYGSSIYKLRTKLIFAGETTGIHNVMQDKWINSQYFDLQGRPVKDAPKHGIYVKDGRKVIR